jgi:hypothetical protein
MEVRQTDPVGYLAIAGSLVAPTHGYEPTREAAMAAFAKSWRRDT